MGRVVVELGYGRLSRLSFEDDDDEDEADEEPDLSPPFGAWPM